MTTNTGTSRFDRASLHTLADLVGGSWRLVTGYPLSQRPGSFFAFEDVVAAVEGREVTLHSELAVLGFEGHAEKYPHLSVVDGSDRLDAVRQDGQAWFQHQGKEVLGVDVVRETITALRHGETVWVYSTDIGVVLELSGGAIGIIKVSHHNEALLITIADSVDGLGLPDHTSACDWDIEPGKEYRRTREIIPVGALLGE